MAKQASLADLVPIGESEGFSEIELVADIIVFGMIAAHWSDSGDGPCKRGWGSELRRGGILYKNDMWTATKIPSDKLPEAMLRYGPAVAGVRVNRQIDPFGEKKGRMQSWWIPCRALSAAKLRVEGFEF